MSQNFFTTKLSVKTKDIKSMNISIFNVCPVIAALNNSTSKLFELVNQLNKSTILIVVIFFQY